jgi:hypothetical protein
MTTSILSYCLNVAVLSCGSVLTGVVGEGSRRDAEQEPDVERAKEGRESTHREGGRRSELDELLRARSRSATRKVGDLCEVRNWRISSLLLLKSSRVKPRV